VLQVEAEEVCTLIYLLRGVPVLAEEGTLGETLGRLLLREGRLSQEQYAHIIAHMTKSMMGSEQLRFGEVAVALGYLTTEQVDDALAMQVRRKVIRCIEWESAQCTFREGADALETLTLYPCPLEPLALRAVQRRFDEARLVAMLEGVADRYPQLVEPASEISRRFKLKPSEAAWLEELDGRRSCFEVIYTAPIGALAASQLLAVLILAEAIQLVERAAASVKPAAASPPQAEAAPGPVAEPVAVEPASGSKAMIGAATAAEGSAADAATASSTAVSSSPSSQRAALAGATDIAAQHAPEEAGGRAELTAAAEQGGLPAERPGAAPPLVVWQEAAAAEQGTERAASAPSSVPAPPSETAPGASAAEPRSPSSVPEVLRQRLARRLARGLERRRTMQSPGQVDSASSAEGEASPTGPASTPPDKQARLVAEQLFQSGKRHLAGQRWALALNDLREAVRLYPAAVEYVLHAEWAKLCTLSDADEIAATRKKLATLAQHALRQDERMAFAHFVRGQVLLMEGDEKRAFRSFRIATRLDPKDQSAARYYRTLSRRHGAKR
jgi:tetratricopeptide (TPR) repeat protein